jgi:phosphohistidine phosphatase
MKTLLLLRHANAEPTVLTRSDKERVLTRQGKADAAKVGLELTKRQLVPDLILCSGADRARETLELVVAGLAGSAPGDGIAVQYEDELYLAEPATVLAHAQGAPEEVSTLMLIGHNPGFGMLGFALAGVGSMPDKLASFPAASVAAFIFEAGHWTDIDPTHARLSQFFTPGELPDQ